MPSVRSTFVDPLLTNVSVAYKPQGLIADQVFPTVVVNKETGIYFVKDKENLRAPADALRGEFSRANRVTNTLTQATYELQEKSLETPISERVMKNYDNPFDPKRNATELVTDKLAIDKEKDLVTTLSTAVTPTDLSGSWSTTTTDIIGQIRAGRGTILKNTGHEANTLILSKEAYDLALENADVIERLKYTSRATEQTISTALADFFGVDRILIGKGVENTAKEGQADALNYIWGEYIFLMYVAPSPAIETPSAGYHLQLSNARYVDTWYEQEIKTTFVRANDFYDAKVVDSTAMLAWSNAKA